MDPIPAPAYEPVVDQHESWLALNPRQGCPKGIRLTRAGRPPIF
ncbi:hypothetical protein ACIBCO_38220 [Streptomyces violascens]